MKQRGKDCDAWARCEAVDSTLCANLNLISNTSFITAAKLHLPYHHQSITATMKAVDKTTACIPRRRMAADFMTPSPTRSA